MKRSAFVPIIRGPNQRFWFCSDNKLRYRNVWAFVSISLSTASRKTAVSIYDSLDPGPQALAGLRHGVLVEGPHHLLYLLDRILGFVARLCNGPYFKFATHKRIGSWEARPLPPTPPQQCSLSVFPCSWAFLLSQLCRNVTICFYFCFGRQLRRFAKKK